MEKTLTQILEEVKDEICNNYCKYKAECDEALEDNDPDRIHCPLDRL